MTKKIIVLGLVVWNKIFFKDKTSYLYGKLLTPGMRPILTPGTFWGNLGRSPLDNATY